MCADVALNRRYCPKWDSSVLVVWNHLENPCRAEGNFMTEYIVGLRLGKRSEVLTIEAEDALIAALKAKYNHPRL